MELQGMVGTPKIQAAIGTHAAGREDRFEGVTSTVRLVGKHQLRA